MIPTERRGQIMQQQTSHNLQKKLAVINDFCGFGRGSIADHFGDAYSVLPAADRDFFRSHRLRELLLRGLYGAYAGVQPRVGKARVNL